MSSTVSSANPIALYLSIVRDEAKQVAAYVKSDPTLTRTASAFTADTVRINQPTDILASKNLPALQVALGAYNLGAQSTQTGLLKQVLLQDPTGSTSLVRKTGNTNYLDFYDSLTARSTVKLDFGDPSTTVFSTAGSTASTLSLRNIAASSPDSGLTAASPAQSFDYVLDNGSAAPAIAAALTTALQATGTAANPVTGSYAADLSGAIIASGDAPALATTKDSAGNTVFTAILARDTNAKPIRIATVVSIGAANPIVSPQPTSLTAKSGADLFAAALTATGFAVARTGNTILSLVNPAASGPLSIAPNAFSNFAALNQLESITSQSVLTLGSGGLALKPGQTLLSGGKLVGTIGSVDSIGDVTLKAPAAIALPAGARIDVAIGAGIANIGSHATASADADTSSTTLNLGTAAAGIQPGQILTNGNAVLGIVASANATGIVTLTGKLAAPVSADDMIGILPGVATGNTPGLQVASTAHNIVSLYEINAYETKQGMQVSGLDTALYFTRIAPTITNVNQILSNTKLLNVITTNLGIHDSFTNLPFDQQISLLKTKVDLKDFINPSKLQHAAEQYLLLTNLQASQTATDNSVAALFGDTGNSNGTDLLSTLYPGSNATDGNSLVSLFTSTDSSSTNNGVSLFA